MSRFVQIIVGAVLTFALLLWSAVWWVTRDQPLRESANVVAPPSAGSRVTAPLDPGQRNAIAAPATAQEQSATTVPRAAALVVDAESSAGRRPFKLHTEPISPPLPPPLKPNAEGTIDLSSDPSTKAFTEALQQGYSRRLAETARSQRDAPASSP
jgi:hypothetical protein